MKTLPPVMAPGALPTLPDDPATPMVGTVRLAAADTMTPVLQDGLIPVPDLVSSLPEDDSGCVVAVVVPMSQPIDEPLIPLTGPSRLETGTGVASFEAPAVGQARIEMDPASDAVPAGSPRDVVGSPFILGGSETRTAGLVAEATDRLMDQLGHLAADHGGALDELDGVRVAVTSTDGSRYEMAVGRAGGHD